MPPAIRPASDGKVTLGNEPGGRADAAAAARGHSHIWRKETEIIQQVRREGNVWMRLTPCRGEARQSPAQTQSPPPP
uniref:Uncharacterized protein n=1 Tax=Knipowitschia caucasica TaxID=637954 RepID=A0AAV2J1Q1_KNICA